VLTEIYDLKIIDPFYNEIVLRRNGQFLSYNYFSSVERRTYEEKGRPAARTVGLCKHA
jgi:hypothetical protein